jgi:alpha-beta hydrolase superfamily lysophospholipase
MATATVVQEGQTVVRQFSGARAMAFVEPGDNLSPESQAALRQLSVERLMEYGVRHADVIELRARVASGEVWQSVATDLAETCLMLADAKEATAATRANMLYRASALLRMSQMMMLVDSAERSAIYQRAGIIFREAAKLTGDRDVVTIETRSGPLSGWRYLPPSGRAVGRVLVTGGVEGWAMDFAAMGPALAARDMEVLLLDAPGHGESRMLLGHYLTREWLGAYRDVVDWLDSSGTRLPIGVIGNSMGGSFAMHLAASDPRIMACCDNGGTTAPTFARPNAAFFRKMMAHVGTHSEDEAVAVWGTVKPADPDNPVRCPLLVVHGGRDPLISGDDATNLFNRAQSQDKEMVIFSDGDHCIYNHSDDKHALIGDWIRSRLVGQ